MMLEPELQDVYVQWKSDWNSPENNAALLKKIQPWIDHAILAAGGSPSNQVLRAKANMMAMAYMRKYDPEASNVKNYLYGQMRGLHRVVGAEQNIIQIPERMALGQKAIAEAEKELTDELGRFPSMMEIADRTGIPLKNIQKWTSFGGPIYESSINNSDTGNSMYLHGNILGEDKAEAAWQEYVYDSLPDRQKAVMERMLGMHGQPVMTPSEIAQSLKISQAAVSQHKKKIYDQLNDDSRYDLFGG